MIVINQLVRYAPLLDRLRADDLSFLEVGSGSDGIAAYLGRRGFGLEIRFPAPPAPELIACGGTATALPFRDEAIDRVLLVDTMEHIPQPLRRRTLEEACRVARVEVIVAGPMGADARRGDDELAAFYARTGRPTPAWLLEHLTERAPDVEDLTSVFAELGWRTQVEGNEHLGTHLALLRFEASRYGGRITDRIRRHAPSASAAVARRLRRGPYYSWIVTASR